MTTTRPKPCPPTPLADLFLRDETEEAPAKRIALLTALLLHLLLITLTWPTVARRIPQPEPKVATVKAIAWLPPPPELQARPQQAPQEALAERLIPIPDPTPELQEVWTEPQEPPTVASDPAAVGIFVEDGVPPPALEPAIPGFGGVSFPILRKETQVLPAYPVLARRAGVTGQVYLEAVVRKDGSVGEIRVLRSPGARLGFDAAAIDAVRQWKYHPGVQNGRPVDVLFTIVVDFILE